MAWASRMTMLSILEDDTLVVIIDSVRSSVPSASGNRHRDIIEREFSAEVVQLKRERDTRP